MLGLGILESSRAKACGCFAYVRMTHVVTVAIFWTRDYIGLSPAYGVP
jgi:hypothetical protein